MPNHDVKVLGHSSFCFQFQEFLPDAASDLYSSSRDSALPLNYQPKQFLFLKLSRVSHKKWHKPQFSQLVYQSSTKGTSPNTTRFQWRQLFQLFVFTCTPTACYLHGELERGVVKCVERFEINQMSYYWPTFRFSNILNSAHYTCITSRYQGGFQNYRVKVYQIHPSYFNI